MVPAGGDDLEAIAASRTVEVVQTLSAGTDWIEPHLPPQATLCAARGARDIPVAEWVVGALLGAPYGQFRAAHLRAWDNGPPRELHALRVLIVGFGSIGRAVQARLEVFGAQVTGVASRARDGVHGAGELPACCPRPTRSSVLLPLSDATRGMIGAAELAAMRDGALLVNAGRGPVVDTDALVAELARGRLEAVLDVTDPEPLPAEHPLWEHALAITPHDAATPSRRGARGRARGRAARALRARRAARPRRARARVSGGRRRRTATAPRRGRAITGLSSSSVRPSASRTSPARAASAAERGEVDRGARRARP